MSLLMKPLLMRLVLAGTMAMSGPLAAACQDPGIDLQGQLSGWLSGNRTTAFKGQIGLRYIPSLSLKKSFGTRFALDAEFSANAYGSALGASLNHLDTSGDVKPYRMWLRFSTSRFEARIGLQKINFGSALLLRPLMWFDRIDPNDPLQLADGVYGLLVKYTFLNNTNFWLWGLSGNTEVKGWESIPTRKGSPEYGGRLQVPLLRGEMAFSYHHRLLDPRRSLTTPLSMEGSKVPESRFALDGKWDLGVGLWFEGVLARQDFDFFPLRHQRTFTLGLDYTFGLGNGLHIMGEHLTFQTTRSLFGSGETTKFSTLSLDYPLMLTDRIKGMVLRNWETGDWYRFITWQRMSDRWSFYVIAFWNPDRYQIYASQTGKSLFAGKGLEIMVVFNH
jgi:hypothetical protein